ncbi:MAG: fused MFS/spermidine synthase [Verrucomicrobia bacterium]|nr:fused MFS/spermidine synthase [Verrucomicrobiota bacterium]
MAAFGLTLFTGAFLLFLVQPLIAKFILPWFGGTPAVWTTCMLVFQVLLLGGYAYAHLLIRHLTPRRQVVVHLALLALALVLLPITPGEHWKPPDGTFPMGRILLLLTACLGLPYWVLSATGPLMQAWFSQVYPHKTPYRLYALSNSGSLLALLSYPFVVEPAFARQAQAQGWSLGFGLFALLATWCGGRVWQRADEREGHKTSGSPSGRQGVEQEPGTADGTVAGAGPAGATGLWLGLPACATVLLLAVTNKICLDIAVIPFLWVLPLSLYLVSFIVSFDNPRWYARWFWLPALAVALAAALCIALGEHVVVPDRLLLRPVGWLLQRAEALSLFSTLAIYLATLFVGCMVCHGELYRLRPAASRLTAYYLAIAAGGALGGFLVAVLAPVLFRDYFELPLGLFGVGALAATMLWVDPKSPLHHGRRVWAWSLVVPAVIGLGAGFYHGAAAGVRNPVEVTRSFYGVLKVEEYWTSDLEAHEVRLLHGTTTHGVQFPSGQQRTQPTSYYTPQSGIGRTMQHFPRATHRRVGVVGLGTGTMAAWGREGDEFRIYEINADVERLARERFFYLADSPARIEIVPGDARLSLEREPEQGFDILVLDAFSSDSIPVHLLTREAFALYLRHLKPDGVLAFHISNQYLDLEPVVRRAAEHFQLDIAVVHDDETWDAEDELDTQSYATDWAILTRNAVFLALPAIAEAAGAVPDIPPHIRLWTDEHSSLLPILDLEPDTWPARVRRWLP